MDHGSTEKQSERPKRGQGIDRVVDIAMMTGDDHSRAWMSLHHESLGNLVKWALVSVMGRTLRAV
jgi:hypothetical protein